MFGLIGFRAATIHSAGSRAHGVARYDLLMVFLGLWDEWEVPMILEDYDVIDDLESEYIWGLLGAGRDPETVLKKYVREAYFKHYNRTELLN